MGFPVHFTSWLKICVTTIMFSIGAMEGFFSGAKGLRQWDPISPYLFDLAMEVLTACLKYKAASLSFKYHWNAEEQKITHLIFAEDVILFSKGDLNSVRLLLKGFNLFSRISGLVPSPSKCSCFFSNVPLVTIREIWSSTGFCWGDFPMKFLGLPLVSGRLRLIVNLLL